MTRNEVASEIYYIVGDWAKVNQIFALMGKLTPEPTGKPQAPAYDQAKVRRVGKEKLKFTSKQRLETRALLREMGLI